MLKIQAIKSMMNERKKKKEKKKKGRRLNFK